jgi:simple sugar transport system permease protein
MKSYVLTGILASVAGIIMTARTNSAKADYGSSYVLQAVLVAVLGGVNPAGGFGSVIGLSIAVLSLQFLSSGFNMLRFSNFATEFTWGLFLLLIMGINYFSEQTLKIYQIRGVQMKKFMNKAEEFVDEMLEGIYVSHR